MSLNPFSILARRAHRWAALCAVLFLSSAALIGVAEARKTKIKLATLAPRGSLFFRAVQEMGESWVKASGGQLRFRVYPGGVAGSDADVIRKLRLGSLQAAMVTSLGLASVDRSINVFHLPLAIRSNAELDHLIKVMGAKLEAAYAKHGLVLLALADAGWARFMAKSPLRTPADIEKHMLFTSGNSKMTEIWERAGFRVRPLPETEIPTALQTGLITALPTTSQAAMLMQWYRHAQHMLDVPISPFVGGIVLRKELWDSFEPALQEKIRAAAQAAASQIIREGRPAEEESLQAMQSRGLTLHKASAADLKAWRARVDALKDLIRGPYLPAPLYDEVMEQLSAFRAQQGQ
ncbi:MAG: TRAP transporter substrate-binding protein DctP [Myxococcota bacterium]|nr:TRAP transporter substrate-binding protein DctP [Myxococcota bacterium]